MDFPCVTRLLYFPRAWMMYSFPCSVGLEKSSGDWKRRELLSLSLPSPLFCLCSLLVVLDSRVFPLTKRKLFPSSPLFSHARSCFARNTFPPSLPETETADLSPGIRIVLSRNRDETILGGGEIFISTIRIDLRCGLIIIREWRWRRDIWRKVSRRNNLRTNLRILFLHEKLKRKIFLLRSNRRRYKDIYIILESFV